MSGRTGRAGVLGMLVLAILLLAAAPASAAKPKKAKELGPTPVENDCLIYRGDNPCYYGLWSGQFKVDKHVLQVGDTLTATIQTYGGRYPVYSWASPGGSGLTVQSCPREAPPAPPDGSPNYFSATCVFKAVRPSGGWVVFGPTMGLAISQYQDGDYYAVVGGASVTGRVLDGDGLGVAGVRVNISGPDDVYAITDTAGFYDAIDLAPGTYSVTLGKSKFCADEGTAISTKTCKRKVTKRISGNLEVNWKGLGKYAIFGTIKDEFGRGLAGVDVTASGLPGGETVTVKTYADGTYRIGLEDAVTVSLAAKGANRGPYELYYVIDPKTGVVSTGQAADVTPNAKEKQVKVDWELDRRLQISGSRSDVKADGFSHGSMTAIARTQHYDPAPGVELEIDPQSGSAPAAICSTGRELLWPSTFSDGTPDVAPTFTLTTGRDGTVSWVVYAGTQAGNFNVDVSRKSDHLQFGFVPGYLADQPGTDLTSGEQIMGMLVAAGQSGPGGKKTPLPFLPSQTQVVEWIAGLRGIGANSLAGVDLLPVALETGRRGVLLFGRGRGPAVRSGIVGVSANTYVLDPTYTSDLIGLNRLPTLAEWAGGQTVVATIPDARTYLGMPIPVRAGVGFGTCIDGATDGASIFTVHSPVNVLFTDASGKRVGLLANGTPVSEIAGAAVYTQGEAVTIVAPPGAYTASMVGTGAGPVTIESDGPGGTTTSRFTAKKGKKATVKLDGSGPVPAFTFNGTRVRPVKGTVLFVDGLPAFLGKMQANAPIKLKVTDPSGNAVPRATLKVKGPDGEWMTMTADTGGNVTGYWPPSGAKRISVVIGAEGYASSTYAIAIGKPGGKKK